MGNQIVDENEKLINETKQNDFRPFNCLGHHLAVVELGRQIPKKLINKEENNAKEIN